ncbi:hypothetical protein LTR16_000050 [Cryomyces antarcticus]|uniref:Uncharacterized protein n=1 Tax=Cryomyces antarcticus TaxID=329879 RepID=A0ABR0M9J8_9PEZI|nr:hypothetical protein LTR39_000782 [Cryomyces antarcticus]KAK5020171.1 hypothetical protein LTR60_000772 [Cryomyces antarcticus]KAK5297033.1 hypothetical protein LTR16_000050 [Cryomyces antarcticus]
MSAPPENQWRRPRPHNQNPSSHNAQARNPQNKPRSRDRSLNSSPRPTVVGGPKTNSTSTVPSNGGPSGQQESGKQAPPMTSVQSNVWNRNRNRSGSAVGERGRSAAGRDSAGGGKETAESSSAEGERPSANVFNATESRDFLRRGYQSIDQRAALWKPSGTSSPSKGGAAWGSKRTHTFRGAVCSSPD